MEKMVNIQRSGMDVFGGFFHRKKILITGHTGFKGSWLSIWLDHLGANIVGYSLKPYTDRDNYVLTKIGKFIHDERGDINDIQRLEKVFRKYEPEIVFHLAAQPLVRVSYEIPYETYYINLMGAINIMEAFRKCRQSKVCIMVTSDKCYENKEQIWGYREIDPMGGYDPYSSSKGAVEIAIASWRRSFMNPETYDKHGKSLASVRAGNIIGGGDWRVDRLVPDCIKAIEAGKKIEIRNPNAIRPWQYVLEPLKGYLLLAQKMWDSPALYSDGWNFGPSHDSIASVRFVTKKIIDHYGKGSLKKTSASSDLHEAQLLLLDSNKARIKLGWKTKMNLDQSIAATVGWYKKYGLGGVHDLCLSQILEYVAI